VAAFKQALKIDANHPMALFNLGIVYRDDLKELPQALEVWEAFLDKAGDAPHAVMVRPWVKQLREKIEAAGSSSTGSGAK
jgi:cytochrome c-type biogenesis protein CcmH/NrfG